MTKDIPYLPTHSVIVCNIISHYTSIAMVSSSLIGPSAPISSHVVSGTVTKPSLFEDGCTRDRAT